MGTFFYYNTIIGSHSEASPGHKNSSESLLVMSDKVDDMSRWILDSSPCTVFQTPLYYGVYLSGLPCLI